MGHVALPGLFSRLVPSGARRALLISIPLQPEIKSNRDSPRTAPRKPAPIEQFPSKPQGQAAGLGGQPSPIILDQGAAMGQAEPRSGPSLQAGFVGGLCRLLFEGA